MNLLLKLMAKYITIKISAVSIEYEKKLIIANAY
jgi:hypothetical protein